MHGLDDDGEWEWARGIAEVEDAAGGRGNAELHRGEFGGDLVHRVACGPGLAADEGAAVGFEEVLERAALAPAAVQGGEDHVSREALEFGEGEFVDGLVVDGGETARLAQGFGDEVGGVEGDGALGVGAAAEDEDGEGGHGVLERKERTTKAQRDEDGAKRELEDDALEAVAKKGDVEVDQEAEAFVGQPKVGQELGLVDFRECIDCLEFNNDAIIHDEVQLVAGIQRSGAIHDGDGDFALERHAQFFEFDPHALVVDRFEQAGAKGPVYRDCRSDDRPRQRIVRGKWALWIPYVFRHHKNPFLAPISSVRLRVSVPSWFCIGIGMK